jgi:hypothetical protein
MAWSQYCPESDDAKMSIDLDILIIAHLGKIIAQERSSNNCYN